jgi:hypothetical protein
MKKFLFIYNASPEDDSDTMDDWMKWFGSLGESVVDIGNPFDGGKLVNASGAIDISSWSDFVGGYSLINAADMDGAIAIAKNCPNKAGVRIFEAIPM